MEADANAARSIATGGTGASTAAAARTNLGLVIGTDVAAYSDRVPSGVIAPYAGSSAPSGWLLCYGQAVSRSTYSALFSAISTTFGAGDGSTTFNLPDLRGRVVAGKDNMGGTSANRLTDQTGGLDGDTLGDTGGAETHTLTEAQLPSHTHAGTTASDGSHGHPTYVATSVEGSLSSDATGGLVLNTASSAVYAAHDSTTPDADAGDQIGMAGAHTHTFTTDAAGSGSAHNNVQPTIILNYIVKT